MKEKGGERETNTKKGEFARGLIQKDGGFKLSDHKRR